MDLSNDIPTVSRQIKMLEGQVSDRRKHFDNLVMAEKGVEIGDLFKSRKTGFQYKIEGGCAHPGGFLSLRAVRFYPNRKPGFQTARSDTWLNLSEVEKV